TAKSNRFGSFYILVDTIAPKIQPLGLYSDMTGKSFIEFKITDNLAGIASYNIYINDNWVLGEYEPKKSSLRYYFDNRLPKTELYKLKVSVADNLNNESNFEFEFIRK
ncbi:MAG: M23 family peptidase, partial [Bacteroidales bacterium]|nr:M23 family peptidase [Bacteroidales bacterium]